MSELSVIIPVFNEEKTVAELLNQVLAVHLINDFKKQIIVVNDGSTDRTIEILNTLHDQISFEIVTMPKNSGKGAAIREGLKHVTGDYTIIQDADLEYDPENFNNLLQHALDHNAEVVYGSRRLNKHNIQYSGLSYYVGGMALGWLTNLLYGQKITDEPTCYKLIKTDLLKRLPLACERFEFCPEVTALIAKQNIKIPEVPIAYHPRTALQGKKINWHDGIEAIWTLLKLRFMGEEKSTARWCLGLALAFAMLVAIFDFSVAGIYQRDGDTVGYINMIQFIAGRPLSPTDVPYYRLIKPMYGYFGAALLPIMQPETSILILNLIFYFGIIFIFFEILKKHLKFESLMALLGTAWFVCSYPMLKTGFVLITDLSGWFFALLTIWITLEAEALNRDDLLPLAGLAAAIGLTGKETGAMGMLFVFVYFLLQISSTGWKRTIKRWLLAGLPFALASGAAQYAIYHAWHYTFYDWIFKKADLSSNAWRQPIYFIGTQLAAFHILWLYAFIGLFNIRKLKTWKTLTSLVPVGLTTYAWVIYLVRILFFQFVFVIPLALFGWNLTAQKFTRQRKIIYFLGATLPLLMSLVLFLLIGRQNAFALLHLVKSK